MHVSMHSSAQQTWVDNDSVVFWIAEGKRQVWSRSRNKGPCKRGELWRGRLSLVGALVEKVCYVLTSVSLADTNLLRHSLVAPYHDGES